MSLNTKEIDLILDELKLEGRFIQKIIQPSYTALVFYLYSDSPMTLFVSLEAGGCRLHSTQSKIPKFDKPMRFMELLRSRIKGAKIEKAEQLNEDRIIKLSLSGGCGNYFLYIRLWSGAGNMVLTDVKDNIIDAFYRRPGRGEISGGKFILPEKKTGHNEYSIRSYDIGQPFNAAIEQWYLNNAPKISREALLDEAENIFGAKIKKLENTIAKLEQKRNEFLNAEALKNTGDLLFSNLHVLKKGMRFVELEDYSKGNLKISINLDPLKSPQENANAYYEKYKKAVSGLDAVTGDILSYKNDIKTLQQKLLTIKEEENPYIIQKLLQREKIPLQQKAKDKKSVPGLQFLCSGWTLLVGRTAAENDELLRHFVKGADLWLHTRDYAGGYVFIKAKPKKTVPLPVLLKAGNLAVFYSKARQNGSADLYTTQVKYLRRAKNAPKGTVLPTHERNLSIKLDTAILKELEEEKII